VARLVLLVLIALPFVELSLLLALGERIGFGPTMLFISMSALLGSAIARRKGVGLLRRLHGELQAGRPPAEALVDDALVVLGGVLLILPGVLSDLVGLLLVLPPTRALVRLALGRWFRKRVRVDATTFRPGGPQPVRRAGPGDVIDVEGTVRDPTVHEQALGDSPPREPTPDESTSRESTSREATVLEPEAAVRGGGAPSAPDPPPVRG
jgi:UPF0716 protein FxsA